MNWMKVELDEEGGVMGNELKGKSQKWQFIIAPGIEMVKAEGEFRFKERKKKIKALTFQNMFKSTLKITYQIIYSD